MGRFNMAGYNAKSGKTQSAYRVLLFLKTSGTRFAKGLERIEHSLGIPNILIVAAPRMSTTGESTVPISNFRNHFLAWVKNPLDVASVCPSSHALTSLIANRPTVRNAEIVVDLGPGNGETSRALLRQMKSGSTLLAIEQNRQLAESLRRIQDDRLIALNDDAKNLGRLVKQYRLNRPDVIVSGIPFSSLDPEEANRIVRTIYEALGPGGQFIAYQLRSTVDKHACQYFSGPQVTWVWRNIPLLRVFVWTKHDAPSLV
jgi:phosphatidylethanolamine/phosphatidyl-N-methylethanolamine N-methyltransferase